ncbi:methylated-DNA-[protein]-cysteine S-methyltransferase [Bacillus ectoiniformans]|uniref:methylated-DNA--[protein]-cysteine S-methyltransferase n=1 Tax=Bacillus ectoiniformans TaxID=1494429 RepID=UPI001957CDB3|nr:methylated-DNA--[protein]-cysteine S-methyltransferase [Bacillus ectoiniformans]MBM7647329.1 methylated-DNA-[protein]-cysteine S-methyltransferase [Bacillus ectoiniformans]
MEHIYTIIDSPINKLTVTRNSKGICSVSFGEREEAPGFVYSQNDPLLLEASNQLHKYFQGKLHTFDLPLDVQGTPFQQSVWDALRTIPFGKTVSYQEIAALAGNSKAVRAVGQANKANPVPVIIPCHRVIGKNRKLVGYAGSRVDMKEILLKIEGTL